MNPSYQQYYLIYLECQYFVLSFKSKKDCSISLKSTKYNRSKIQKFLELLSQTVDDEWKNTINLNATLSQENLNNGHKVVI